MAEFRGEKEPGISRRTFIKIFGGGAVVAAGAFFGDDLIDMLTKDPPTPEKPDPKKVTIEREKVEGMIDLLDAEWHMSGVQESRSGLRITPTGLAIHKKDDTYQPNPPVSLFGTHLQVSGDFEVSTRTDGKSNVTLTLYGKPPIVYDDFLLERPKLSVPLEASSMRIRRQNGTVSVNGQAIEQDVFDSGEVWFGFDGKGVVTELGAKKLGTDTIELVDTSTLEVVKRDPNGLQVLADKKRPGFKIGAALALHPLVSDKEYAAAALGGNLGIITTENALKPQFVQPEEGVFTFEEAEALITLANRHGMDVHGHTLVFERALPRWMNELPVATAAEKRRVEQVMIDHITSVVSHFKGRIKSWDVVNELLHPKMDGRDFREHLWFRAMNETYIEKALWAAHEADPDAELWLNDYGVEVHKNDSDWRRSRGRVLYDLAKRLKAKGVPFHGVGFQCHVYNIEGDAVDAKGFRQQMRELEDLGLQVRVTEMDVTRGEGEKAQAEQFADVLEACLDAPNCDAFIMWGLSERYSSTSWLDGNKLVYGTGLPWDADMRPLPAVAAMQRVLSS